MKKLSMPDSEPATNPLQQQLNKTVYRVLRALVRVALRFGMPFKQFEALVKQAYVDIAMQEYTLPGRKQTDSRIAVITGLSRKEVRELSAQPEERKIFSVVHYNRAALVLNAWLRDEAYLDGTGKPLALPFDGEGATFTELAKKYGGDIPVRAILDELLRSGAIVRNGQGALQVARQAYVPVNSEEALIDKLGIIGTDVAMLLETIIHNLEHVDEPDKMYFQRKVAYDNLPAEALPVLQAMVAEDGQALLEALNKVLAKMDRDVNPLVSGSGRYHAGVGVYLFKHDLSDRFPEKDLEI